MKKHTRISLNEREIIYLLLQEGSNTIYIANNLYSAGLSRNRALFLNDQLQDYVINNRYPPKEISASLKTFGLELRASTGTIYQFIYSNHRLKLIAHSFKA